MRYWLMFLVLASLPACQVTPSGSVTADENRLAIVAPPALSAPPRARGPEQDGHRQDAGAVEDHALRVWVGCVLERGHALALTSLDSADAVAASALAGCRSEQFTYQKALKALRIDKINPTMTHMLTDKVVDDVRVLRSRG